MVTNEDREHELDLALARSVVDPWLMQFQKQLPRFWIPGLANYGTPLFLARALRTGNLAKLVKAAEAKEDEDGDL